MKWHYVLMVIAAGFFGTACGDDDGTADGSAQDTSSTDQATSDSVEADEGPVTPACNYILNEGCAEGEKCGFPTSGATKAQCTPAGEKAIGEECSGSGDCKEGTCISLNDTGNLCYAFCKTMAHCNLEECLDLKDSPYKVCELDVEYETCNMLAQDCTKNDQGCYVTDDGSVCLPSGTAAVAEECESVSDCAPGGVCINKRCKKICNKTEDDPCGNFQPCANYYGNAGYCDQ
jgi:hypothetical protein